MERDYAIIHIISMYKPSNIRYNTKAEMALDIPLGKTNTEQQA